MFYVDRLFFESKKICRRFPKTRHNVATIREPGWLWVGPGIPTSFLGNRLFLSAERLNNLRCREWKGMYPSRHISHFLVFDIENWNIMLWLESSFLQNATSIDSRTLHQKYFKIVLSIVGVYINGFPGLSVDSFALQKMLKRRNIDWRTEKRLFQLDFNMDACSDFTKISFCEHIRFYVQRTYICARNTVINWAEFSWESIETTARILRINVDANFGSLFSVCSGWIVLNLPYSLEFFSKSSRILHDFHTWRGNKQEDSIGEILNASTVNRYVKYTIITISKQKILTDSMDRHLRCIRICMDKTPSPELSFLWEK